VSNGRRGVGHTSWMRMDGEPAPRRIIQGRDRTCQEEQAREKGAHCPRRDLGATDSTRLVPFARNWAMTRPASAVLPSPTSSARMHPPSGDTTKLKHDSVDLVRVWVNPSATLSGRVPAGGIGSA
jgi:hypothetical protein